MWSGSPAPGRRSTPSRAPIRSSNRARPHRCDRMLNAAIIGLGWWGKRLVGAAQGSRLIHFARGVALDPEAARDFAAADGTAIGTALQGAPAASPEQAPVASTPRIRHRAPV